MFKGNEDVDEEPIRGTRPPSNIYQRYHVIMEHTSY